MNGAVVFAYSSVGYACLEELLRARVPVAAVYTHEDDPGEERWFSSVRDLALSNGIEVFTPERLGEAEVCRVRSLAPDLIFSFYYRMVIPEAILKVAPLGAFNLHGSLLPRYRGRACVNWAVLNGETETGVTLHRMTRLVDRGRIVDREPVPIGPDETAHDVFLKLIPAARLVLRRSLPALLAGTAEGVEQDEAQATHFGRRRPEDGALNWNEPARKLHDLVRAVTHPFPGAFTFLDEKKLYVWRASQTADNSTERPGTVLSSSPLKVATGDGVLWILRAQWAEAAEADGAEMRIPAGVVLS